MGGWRAGWRQRLSEPHHSNAQPHISERGCGTVGQHGAVAAMQGKRRAVVQALEVITEAVDRYKELCEGKYAGG